MFVSECLSVNTKNHLDIGGCDTIDLIKEFGSPLYVMDESLVRKNCRTYKNAIDECYNGKGKIAYASKAFSCKYMYKIAKEEGLAIDVVSGGELYTAMQAGFPTSEVYFHGNNKSYAEIEMAIQNKVGRIVVDHIFELDTIDEIAKRLNAVPKISFRIKPGVDAHTHEFVQTGGIDSKFGVALETGEAMDIIKYAISLKNVEVVGIHCHIGSQIFIREPFELAAKRLIALMCDVKEQTGVTLTELNLGGGYGIKYLESDDPIAYDEYIEAVSKVVKTVAAECSFDLPNVVMEPGRSIVGSAGITLYTVGAVKEIPNIRTYVSVDGSLADNPRYTMYEALYEAVVANKAGNERTHSYRVSGRCCETDTLIPDIKLCEVTPGDTLAVLATGAYNYAMSSNYNRLPRPAVVMVNNGAAKVVVKRESYEDLIKNDL